MCYHLHFQKITLALHTEDRLTLWLGTQTAFTRGRGDDLVCPFNLLKVFVKLKCKSENANKVSLSTEKQAKAHARKPTWGVTSQTGAPIATS